MKVDAKRHMNVRDIFGMEHIINNETMEKRVWTIEHARMGHMERYLDKHDWWYNTTELPPIEEYRTSQQLMAIRNHRYAAYHEDEGIHTGWDEYIVNVTEVTQEMYAYYVVHESGTYMSPNTSWVMIFIQKDDNASIWLARHLNKESIHLHEKGFKAIYIDVQQDEEITMAYDFFQVPQVWVIDNETKMAYCANLTTLYEWYTEHNGTTRDFYTERHYKEHNYLFYEAPGPLYYKRAQFYVLWDMYRLLYFIVIGNYINFFFSKLTLINWLPPISLIFDHDGSDLFGFKQQLQFKVFVASLVIFVLFLIHLFRLIFCKKIKKVRKFKPLVDDDDSKEVKKKR